MKKYLKQGVSYILALAIIVSSSWLSMPVVQAKIFDFKASVSTERIANKTQFMFDEEFVSNNEVTLDYSVQFDAIPKRAVEGNRRPKEVVIIIDTSGSMDWNLEGKSYHRDDSRLDITKAAAVNFLTQLSGLENVKVSLINYASEAWVYESNGTKLFDLKSNLQKLNREIESLKANGGTNIGDAMRHAHYTLKNEGNKEADQYIILMTDGEPTKYSVEKNNSSKFLMTDGRASRIRDNQTKGLEYANKIATDLIAETSTINYGIAFSNHSAGNKLKQITNSMAGSYHHAETASAMNAVYNEIAQEISVEASLNDVVFEEELPNGIEVVDLPDGFSITGNTLKANWKRIEYTLNEGTQYYEAPTLNFQIKVRIVEPGIFNLGSSSNQSGIYYKDLDGNLGHKYFPEVIIQADAFVEGEDSYLDLARTASRTALKLSEDPEDNHIQLNYSINFKPVEIKNLPDENPDRDIILVFDTSGSMKNNIAGTWENGERLSVAKASAKIFVDKFSDYSNTKIGLVAFDSSASFVSQLTADKVNVKNRINNFNANGGTNTGDGLRQAYHALNNNNQAEKHIVLMTDGEPTSFSVSSELDYSRNGSSVGSNYKWEEDWFWGQSWGWNWTQTDVGRINSKPEFKTDAGDAYEFFVSYSKWDYNSGRYKSNDYNNYGYNYAKKISEMIKESNINAHYIAFSSDAANNVLDDLSKDADANYYQALSAREMENVYNQIASDITATVFLDSFQFEEELPVGVKVINKPDGFNQTENRISKNFGKIGYTLNAETNMYEAAPIEFTIEVEIEEPGNYVFGDDGTSFVTYVDTEQNLRELSFPELTINAEEVFSAPPIISTDFEEDMVIITGEEVEGNKPTISIHAKFDGIKVDIVETAYKKLENDKETATIDDFTGSNAATNKLMIKDNESPFEDNDPKNDVVILEKMEVTENGFYAIYAKNALGLETVEVIEVDIFVKLPDVI